MIQSTVELWCVSTRSQISIPQHHQPISNHVADAKVLRLHRVPMHDILDHHDGLRRHVSERGLCGATLTKAPAKPPAKSANPKNRMTLAFHTIGSPPERENESTVKRPLSIEFTLGHAVSACCFASAGAPPSSLTLSFQARSKYRAASRQTSRAPRRHTLHASTGPRP